MYNCTAVIYEKGVTGEFDGKIQYNALKINKLSICAKEKELLYLHSKLGDFILFLKNEVRLNKVCRNEKYHRLTSPNSPQ